MLSLLARRLGSGRLRSAAIELAVLGGLLAGYGLIFGLPGWPPVSARDKLVAVALIGAALGVLLARPRLGRRTTSAVLVLWPVVLIVWLAWPSLQTLTPGPLIITLALTAVGAGFLHRWDRDACRGPQRALMLISIALGLALVGVAGSAISIAQLALALAAAVIGTALLSGTAEFARATLTGPSSLTLGLAANLALFSDASWTALLCLTPIPWADGLTRQLARGQPTWVQWLVFAVGCLFPLGVAATVIRNLG